MPQLCRVLLVHVVDVGRVKGEQGVILCAPSLAVVWMLEVDILDRVDEGDANAERIKR